jgi:hypothetical protein
VIALLDVNLLVALFDGAHVHHAPAQAWLATDHSLGWATCPVTQNGCIRVLSQPRYPGALPVAEITRRLRDATGTPDHVFWPDSISLCDPRLFDHDNVLSPKPLTDVYLLALAIANGGRLVTFDRTIPLSAVRKATGRDLLVL